MFFVCSVKHELFYRVKSVIFVEDCRCSKSIFENFMLHVT